MSSVSKKELLQQYKHHLSWYKTFLKEFWEATDSKQKVLCALLVTEEAGVTDALANLLALAGNDEYMKSVAKRARVLRRVTDEVISSVQ